MFLGSPIVQAARQAHQTLKEAIHDLDIDMVGEGESWLEKGLAVRSTGFPVLDRGLETGGVPEGATVEIRAGSAYESISLAMKCMAVDFHCEQARILADPFGEFDSEALKEHGLFMLRTIVLAEENPRDLAEMLLRLIERRSCRIVVLPPWLLREKWLDGGVPPAYWGGSPEQAAFFTALSSISWAARRNGTVLLLLRELPKRGLVPPLGLSQIRLHLLPCAVENRWKVWIKHNAFARESVGRIVRI